MEHVKSFHVMFLILLSTQLAMSNGDLTCFALKYSTCILEFVQGAVGQQCLADTTNQCIENKAVECGITNSTEKEQTEEILTEICKEGTDLNKAYLKSKACLFGQELAISNLECQKEALKAVEASKYKPTGDTDKDQRAVFHIICKYGGDARKCISKNVERICGAEALSFQKKLSGPSAELEEKACNSATTFGVFWTLLLQSAAILISLQYFRLTK